jgi:transcription factor CP2-like protein
MSTASPDHMQLPVEGIIHKASAPPSSPPELTAMTNVVSVLDLHKGDFANETKIYDKSTNTVYVYSSAPKIDDSNAASSSSPPALHPATTQQLSPETHQHQQMHQVVINHHPSDLSIDNALKDEHFELMQENGVMLQRIVSDQLAEGRTMLHTITTDGRGGSGEQQILTKISASDDSLFRLIESNQLVSKIVGENQQIISREIINGEHHIITRNENGEHILTRIVNTSAMDHSLNASAKMNGHGEIYGTTHANGTKVIDDGKTQIIYDATNGGVIKTSQPYDNNLNPDVQKQIDLIYEDGNKAVVYTTAGGAVAIATTPDSPHDDVETKGLELFSASGECLNGTQVIVQGNLQYTPQIQPDGTTVYVVSEIVSDLNG